MACACTQLLLSQTFHVLEGFKELSKLGGRLLHIRTQLLLSQTFHVLVVFKELSKLWGFPRIDEPNELVDPENGREKKENSSK